MSKRVCIFSVTCCDGAMGDDDVNKLTELESLSTEVVAVIPHSTSNAVKEKLSGYVSEMVDSADILSADCFIAGIKHVFQKYRKDYYEEIVFLDNSFYGPFNGFKEIFETAEDRFARADFWGIWGVGARDSFYIHPSFIALKKKLFTSDAFDIFCDFLEKDKKKDDFPKTFTSFFTGKNFLADCIFFSGEDQEGYETVRLGAPVIAKKNFSVSFSHVISSEIASDMKAVLDFIERNTAYDTDAIYRDLIGSFDPFELLSLLGNHFIVGEGGEIRRRKDAVIVFHMYYEDQMEGNLQRLDAAALAADVIITTTSKSRAEIIAEKVKRFSRLRKAVVLISEGNGRDLAALLVSARPYLDKYKYIGFTHDKKSFHHGKKGGDGFKRIIVENILSSPEYVSGVIDLFENNSRLGLLVPPAPEHEKYFAVTGRRWAANFSYYQTLCRKLNIEMSADPRWSSFALGTAFWCRYDALKDLLSYDWHYCDFPSEPLPLNGSISHAIERCLPYIAKKNYYYSGIIYNSAFASMYLCGREYMLTDFMILMNRRFSADGLTYGEYKEKISDCGAMDSVSLKTALKAQKKKVRVIQKSKYFDGKWYAEKYSDVHKTHLSSAEHYLTRGWIEGKYPSAEFTDEKFSPIINDAVSNGINPLYFYEKCVKLKQEENNRGNYRACRLIRNIRRRLGLFFCSEMVKKNSNARILVILHLFYMQSWGEIKEYLRNLDVYNYRLIVTYTPDNMDNNVLSDIKRYKPDAELKKFPNLGYDIGSFTEVLSDITLADYDILFKLQSKGVGRPKIFIYGQYFKKRDWFLHLFEGCVGSFTVHRTIDRLMNDDSIGLAGAKNLMVTDPVHKQNMVKTFMKERGICIPPKYLFVAGTCFAVRSALLQPVKDMRLKIHDYHYAGRAFSLAHKMERLLCLTVLNQGYDFYGNNVLFLRRLFRKLSPDYYIRKKYSGLRLLNDRRFVLDDEFVYFNLEHRLVKKYELVDIPLKNIKRNWMGEDIPLTQCHPYQFLQTRDSDIYDEYCRLNREVYNLDVMSEERFQKLIESIEKNGLDPKRIVVVNKDNVLADGQHRCCYMLYKYGEDYRIPCLKIYDLDYMEKIKKIIKSRLSPKTVERLKRFYHRFV